MLARAQRFLDARIIFDHMHAERVKRTDRVELVNQRVHNDQILVTVLRSVPQGVARTTGRHESQRLVHGHGTRVLLGHGNPNAMHAKACRFRRKSVRHHARHDVTRIATAAVILAKHHLNARGTSPTVNIDQENHANHIVGIRGIDLAIAIMVGFGDDGPCDRATRLRIPHTGFGRRFALGPCHGTTHPRMHRATLGNPILAGDSGSADVRPNGVHTFKIFDHGRTQMHHLALDRRNDDEIRQFTRLLVQLLLCRSLNLFWHYSCPLHHCRHDRRRTHTEGIVPDCMSAVNPRGGNRCTYSSTSIT